MSMAYIRQSYRVPAKRGARIIYSGDGCPAIGTIVASRSQYIRVRFDDEPDRIETLHPTWEVEYLSEKKPSKTG